MHDHSLEKGMLLNVKASKMYCDLQTEKKNVR